MTTDDDNSVNGSRDAQDRLRQTVPGLQTLYEFPGSGQEDDGLVADDDNQRAVFDGALEITVFTLDGFVIDVDEFARSRYPEVRRPLTDHRIGVDAVPAQQQRVAEKCP